MTAPTGDRSTGPRRPGDPSSGTVLSGDVQTGVEAWLAGQHRGSRSSRFGATPSPDAAEKPPPPDSASDGPDADSEEVARVILLDQLAGRARTKAELARILARRRVPEEIAGRLLTRFEEVGLIDDRAFARAWVESRSAGKGLARRALAQELRRKGVDDRVVRDAVDDLDPELEVEAARALVRRKMRSLAGKDRATALRRLTGMLARRGYPSHVALSVVREELEAPGHGVDEGLDDGV